MNITECMIKELQKMEQEGDKTLHIYYAEDMSNPTEMWSVDVMCDRINNACKMSWAWTVISAAEEEAYRKEFNDDSPAEDYEIIVYGENFSDSVICGAIQTWLLHFGFDNKFDVVMIKLEDAAPYSGYVKDLMERDLDEELKNAVPLNEL